MEDLGEYEKWVRRAATECFLSASKDCPVIFIQTDRRKGGRQFSKARPGDPPESGPSQTPGRERYGLP
jgi:hypothetical protein